MSFTAYIVEQLFNSDPKIRDAFAFSSVTCINPNPIFQTQSATMCYASVERGFKADETQLSDNL